jgi:hypothetical protein
MQDTPRAGARSPSAPPPLIGGRSFSNRAAVFGALLLFAACGYRRFWHPDWSGGQALAALWPVYVVGCVPILVRWAIPWAARTRS